MHQTKTFVGAPNSKVQHDGVDIVLVHGSGYKSNVGLARLIHIKTHSISLKSLLHKADPPDVILTAMPTADACEVVLEYAKPLRIPVIVDVRDEWPEDFVRVLPKFAQGIGRTLLRPAFWKLGMVCREADHIVAVSERQLSYGLKAAKRAQRSGDRVFYTGVPEIRSFVENSEDVRDIRQAFGIQPHAFLCVFAGALSKSRPLAPIIAAVSELSKSIPIVLAIAGQGDLKKHYEMLAAHSEAVKFLGWLESHALNSVLVAADILVAPYHPEFGFSLPTKLFDYFQVGRPVLSSCGGEAWSLIELRKLGMNYQFDDVPGIMRALTTLYNNPQLRLEMGERAKAVFSEKFSTLSIQTSFCEYLEGVGQNQNSRQNI